MMLNVYMQEVLNLNADFDGLKFTSKLILIENENIIRVANVGDGRIISEINNMKLNDLITNKKSEGFVNRETRTYYKLILKKTAIF